MSGTSETLRSSANAIVKWAIASLAPLVASTSVAGSTATPKRRLMKRATDSRKRVVPRKGG